MGLSVVAIILLHGHSPDAVSYTHLIEEKTYTTKEPSRPITKEIRLKGHWRLTSPMENVRLEQQGDQTVLTVTCQHGQPVEMLMENK